MPCVLVVDDDDDVRESLCEVLADAGYDVHAAADGREALREMRSQRPCVVLLDLMMPVVDGWSVAEEMRNDPALADVRICVVTAMPQSAPVWATCLLKKPVSLAHVLDAVEQSCGPP
jgi:CheY-like chemotaxis protein